MSSASRRVDSLIDSALPYVRQLAPYVPGARPQQLGEQVCRLASNENPLGSSPMAQAALRGEADLSRYPDNEGHALKEALSLHHGCPMEALMLGNGSSDLLDLVAHAWLAPGRSAVFARHAFVVYPLVVQAVGAAARVAEANPVRDAQPLGHDLAALRAQIHEETAVVFLANPNNPTGTVLADEALQAFFDDLPASVLVVLDEAYAEYREPMPAAGRFQAYPQVIETRTFSKIYGLAGLRIGYAVAHPKLIDILNRVRQPFNVNTLAQQAARAALADTEHVARSRASSQDGLQRLAAAAHKLDLCVLGTHANFLTLNFEQEAAPVADFFRQQNILVRTLVEYELPHCLRITIGTADEMTNVIDALCAWRSS